MIIGKAYEWDWESRETGWDIRFPLREGEYKGDEKGAQLILRKDKRGRAARYTASYFYLTGLDGKRALFFPSDHGGARGARRAALNWIKAQHEKSAS
tara:strand:+ start:366 stop:656 length:291 start_codon:yes stop_codon:yes gene_type:complete